MMFKMSPKTNSQRNPKLEPPSNLKNSQIQRETEIFSYLAEAKELLKEHRRKGH